jgi:hypothetical protein
MIHQQVSRVDLRRQRNLDPRSDFQQVSADPHSLCSQGQFVGAAACLLPSNLAALVPYLHCSRARHLELRLKAGAAVKLTQSL